MSKGSIVAGVLVAIVAGAAVGYFVMPMLFPARQTFFYSQAASQSISSSYTTITYLNIDFTTEAGDSVVFSFTCNVIMEPSSSGVKTFSIYFVIDGVRITSHYLSIVEDLTGIMTARSAALRYVVTGISPGAHNVTVQAITDAGGIDNFCQDNVPTVQIC